MGSQRRTPCKNPLCRNTIARSSGAPGRPRLYCCPACGRAARRNKANTTARTPSTDRQQDDHLTALRDVIADLAARAARIRTQASDTMEQRDFCRLLYEIRLLAEDTEDLQTVAAQQARDRRITAARVGNLWSLHPSKIHRMWRPAHYELQMKRRERRKQQRTRSPQAPTAAPRSDDEKVKDISGPGAAATSRWPPPTDGSPPLPLSDMHIFASALSFLLRNNEKTLAELAQEAGISRSYVSRILSADRFPSWEVTHRLVQVSGGNEAEIRPLWDAAHDCVRSAPRRIVDGTLHDTLRGLYLSASRPAPATIQAASAGQLSLTDINGLLNGSHLTDWTTVQSLVHALRGQPEMVRPLWDAAAQQECRDSSPPARLPASAFG